MHFCLDELAATATAAQHMSCWLCYIKTWWQQLRCHLRGHHR